MSKFYQRNAPQILERGTHSDFTKLNSLWGNDFASDKRSPPLAPAGRERVICPWSRRRRLTELPPTSLFYICNPLE